MQNVQFDEAGYAHFVDFEKATEAQKFAVALHNAYVQEFIDK